MSCNNCNNCAQCNSTPTVAVLPAPTCINTTACEEYILSDCVTSTIEGACSSQLYQYNSNGSLVLDINGDPTPFIPANTLGISITNNENLSNILTDLVSDKNCSFNPNYIAGMLQVIQANPLHPVSQIFCNLVCACIAQCSNECQIEIVETVTFNPANTTETGFVVTFNGLLNYIYTIEVTDTNAVTPTVYSYTYPLPPITTGSAGIVNFNTNLLINSAGISVPTLPSGNTFEVVITSEFANESCSSNSFTTFTNPPISCTCATTEIVQSSFEAGLLGTIGVYIWDDPIQNYTPQFYEITVFDSNGNQVVPTAQYDPTLYPPVGGPALAQMYIEFGSGLFLNGDYILTIRAICEQTPSSICASDPFDFSYTVTAAPSCGPPDITNVIVNP